MIAQFSIENFWKKVNKTDSCWIWLGHKNNFGYGRIHYTENGEYLRTLAHRFSYKYLIGEVPVGLVLDHLCNNRLCVNPYHLKITTHRENILRGIGNPAINSKKTHCKNGHEFNKENTRITKNGRQCVICRRKYSREWAIKKYYKNKLESKMTRGK